MAKGEEQGFIGKTFVKIRFLVKLYKVLFSKIIKIPMKTQKQSRSLSKLIR